MTARLIEAVEAGTATINDFAATFPSETAYGPTTWGEANKAYNGSLDAAKRLHDALLPGWSWTIQDSGENTLWPPNDMADQEWCAQGYECVAPDGCDPARAWLLAILRCLAILRAMEGRE